MALIGTIVGKKSAAENMQGEMHNHEIRYIDYPEYEGDYEATPTTSVQIFATADKRMVANFKVNKTPYSETSNSAGGKTISIL